ncbi:MAG: hypothetical protein ACQ5SW_08195 [Sphaerochaetaceae bacterium]
MNVNSEVRNTLDGIINKALSIVFPADDAYAFLVDTINYAQTLQRLQPEFKGTPSGNLEALTIASRQIREADDTDGDTTTTTDGVSKRQISYSVKKVFWNTWLKNDDVVYNAVRRANMSTGIGATQIDITSTNDLEALIVQMLQKQFAMDLQDLIFNGDVDSISAGGDPDADFLKILDGFVQKSLSSSYITDLGTASITIADMVAHVQLLPEKYKNNFGDSITWFMKQSTHDKLLADLQSRQTGLGDAIILDGRIQRIAGYTVEIVAGLSGPYVNPADYTEGNRGWVGLAPWSNLAPVFTPQGTKYRREATGATAAKRDSTYHHITSYLDAVIKELDGIAIILGDNI